MAGIFSSVAAGPSTVYAYLQSKEQKAAQKQLLESTLGLESDTASQLAESEALMKSLMAMSKSTMDYYSKQLEETQAAAAQALAKAAAADEEDADRRRRAILAMGTRNLSLISTPQSGGKYSGATGFSLRPTLLGS